MFEKRPPYIPDGIGEIMDHLGFMMIYSPTFENKSDWIPNDDFDTVFYVLNESLSRIRDKLGEENFAVLMELSDRMRTHFKADPEDKTDDGIMGRECIVEMEKILRASNSRRKPRGDNDA